MQTWHSFINGDSRDISSLEDKSVDLVITSPPYPMIEMWDEQFAKMNPDIKYCLQNSDYRNCFEKMHLVLDQVWAELHRVLKDGAYACINIGDATRSGNREFQLYANQARIQSKFFNLGLTLLPPIIWRKQTNAPNKFMGSGMLPAGAYVTLEHEYILIFRKGTRRSFVAEQEKENRRRSAYFWEERNSWFSDIWDFKGVKQDINYQKLRNRSAAFPFLLPFRLVNMFSLFGDRVLDPFSGTGTTALAAMAAGRNSINCELDSSFAEPVRDKIIRELPSLNDSNLRRVRDHLQFIKSYCERKGCPQYVNSYFRFPVITRQEVDLKLAFVQTIRESAEGTYELSYHDDYSVKSMDCEKLFFKQPLFNDYRAN